MDRIVDKPISEKQVEEYLKKQLKPLSALCIKFKSPGLSGVPDRIVLKPWRQIYFVEVKRPTGGVISKLQGIVHGMFAACGFPVIIIWSYEDVDKFINRITL